MSNDILIVICEEILPELHRYDKPFGLIPFWINHKGTKAGVSSKILDKFEKQKRKELKNLKETLPYYLGIINGLVNPCQDDEEDPIKSTMNVVNRNYATIKYLIVKDPSKYKNKGLKIDDDAILTPQDFYSMMEVEERSTVSEFLRRKLFE